MTSLSIGLIGDRDDSVPAHRAIPLALAMAAATLADVRVEVTWLPTETLDVKGAGVLRERLSGFGGLWCVPASPYASESGALAGIRFARENRLPFLGTCGGFQHSLLEYARNVLGVTDAAHAENDPGAPQPIISALACPLAGVRGRIFLAEGSLLRRSYGSDDAVEEYTCHYGPDRTVVSRYENGELRYSGRDDADEIRGLELSGDRFFVGCLFQPERSALRGENHPLIQAYVEAVLRGSPAA